MNLYIATRWGNPFEKDGPDGKDTNFIVRAESMGQAAEIVDEALKLYPTSEVNNRPVCDFTQCITQIGIAQSSQSPRLVHGPWIEHLILMDNDDYDYWHRDSPTEGWTNVF